jgi:hypothetical protein
VNTSFWWLPVAALALQLPLPACAALSGVAPGVRAPGTYAFIAAMAGAALGLVYAALTRDAVFAAAQGFAAAGYVGIRGKLSSGRGGRVD